MFAFDDVTFHEKDPLSGEVTVEWAAPDDIYTWDRAVFQAASDGGSVDLYLEEEQAGSWVEVAGPIARGDAIPADPSNNVRFRADFSRSSDAENPTLESVYRRWVV